MMTVPHARQTIAMSLSIVGLILTSCAETKVSQCREIIEVTMDIANDTKDLSNNGQTKEPQAALQVADAFEQAAQEMESISLEDPQLVEYQEGFAQMYLGMSQATHNFIGALNDKDISAAKLAKEELQTLGSTERELVSGINSYCQE